MPAEPLTLPFTWKWPVLAAEKVRAPEAGSVMALKNVMSSADEFVALAVVDENVTGTCEVPAEPRVRTPEPLAFVMAEAADRVSRLLAGVAEVPPLSVTPPVGVAVIARVAMERAPLR